MKSSETLHRHAKRFYGTVISSNSIRLALQCPNSFHQYPQAESGAHHSRGKGVAHVHPPVSKFVAKLADRHNATITGAKSSTLPSSRLADSQSQALQENFAKQTKPLHQLRSSHLSADAILKLQRRLPIHALCGPQSPFLFQEHTNGFNSTN
jgi:hypothetical protein